MLHTNLADVSENYLQGLCDDRTAETQTLEFKLELPRPEARVELLKDLCALANADGGDLVYGIAEAGGCASKVVPMDSRTADAAIRRVGQACDAIEPRLHGVSVHRVSVTGGTVLIARVPKSFDAPHSFLVDSGRRFVIRNTTGTSDMNVDQIRTAFDRTATLADRARTFIGGRFAALQAGDTWGRPFVPGPICAVAFVPLAAAAGRTVVNLAALRERFVEFQHPTWSTIDRAMNLDGLVVHRGTRIDGGIDAYTILHRNGASEAVWSGASRGPEKVIHAGFVTAVYRAMAQKFVRLAVEQQLAGPVILQFALLRVGAFTWKAERDHYAFLSPDTADRQHLLIPEIWVESLEELKSDQQIDDSVVRPSLDILWQAFGKVRCTEFNDAGLWLNH